MFEHRANGIDAIETMQMLLDKRSGHFFLLVKCSVLSVLYYTYSEGMLEMILGECSSSTTTTKARAKKKKKRNDSFVEQFGTN